jgi:murein DD-endopeptidase MepM/ murein hydrolase activator NlpD
MKSILIFLIAALYGVSCHSVSNLFDSKAPHEKYADKLEDKGLESTPEGRQWLAASKTALEVPHAITLPYRQQGYFPAGKSRALGLKFEAKAGERLTFQLTKKARQPLALYADLFKEGGNNTPLHSADTASTGFSFDVDETGSYVLRLQPEMYHTGEYNLSISVGPSLAFPVSGTKAKAGSFWGAARDGGKRRHEGIDIFAPKLTPAVAAADGYITAVRDGGIGGKTVWLRHSDKSVFLYYAHLDKQSVQEGQAVKKGDVIGLVGNTGNAQYTPAHLHFGVYTYSGPVDPLPYVNQAVKSSPAVPVKNLTRSLKLIKTQKTGQGTVVKANTILVPLAVTAKGYIAELPDGNLIKMPFTSVQVLKQPATKPDAIVTIPPATANGS